ncbi:MAG: carboxypeptidase regulatory-like domain-containing protein [Chitinophagaceae bacterium]|nr:carboxypeptidase regulatory-like domain-containing protein [Chitinophagaceae bacterium]
MCWLISNVSLAVTKTSVSSGNWNTAGTWSPSGVPAPTDNVIINHNVVLNVNIDIDPGGSVTVNTGASLIGTGFGIDFNGSTTGGPIAQLTNHGTLTVANVLEATECSYSRVDNYGTMNVVGAAGTTPVFNWRSSDTMYNHSSGTLNVLNGLYRTSNQSWTSCNGGAGKPTTINDGIMNVYDAQFHAGSLFFNHYLINVSPSPAPGIFMAAWEFHNYGCILGGEIDFNSKSNNSGHNISYVHDGSKIHSTIVISTSSHALTGVDDDNSNGNNACIYSPANISNAGTITGELYLNDPDGSVPGTVGPNVTLGTNNCGGPSCSAPSCSISGVTANPGSCNSGNNQYTLTGAITFSNAPSNGTMTVSVSGGGSQVFNAPFTSPANYSISGLNSDGASHNVDVVFSADANCTGTAGYTAPALCVTLASPCANSAMWAINEDNGHLFSVSNWSTQTGVNTTTTDWGLIKWSDDNCATSTNINNSGGSELESAAWDANTNEYYFTSNKSLGSFNAPVLLKIKINDLVNGQQPCATVIGSIAAGGQDIESLAIDPATGDLYGGSKAGGDLYKFNKTTAAIISGYPVQMTKPGGGNLNDAEALTFDYSGNLYVSETDDKDVYIINPVTGAGISTFDNNTAPLGLDGLTWDFVGNRLIGFEDNSANGFSNLFEITPGNGSNILLANTFAAGLVDIEGLELGCQKLTCLGNRVWNDIDEDGIQDASEVGVSGVTVTLYSSTNQILSVTNTDAYGYYAFCQLHPGAYTVGFTLPANYVYSPANSTNDAEDSDANSTTGLTGVYTLIAGDSNMTVDAGIYQPLPVTATVGDRVWFDANSNGLQDVGEPGVSGITVSLFNCMNPLVPVATTITDANGNYLFENVAPGNFQVSFSVPLGMLITTQSGLVGDANNSDVNPLTERTACFTVNGGDYITYVDAGLVPKSATTSSLGDRVWNDANQDGIQDANETGVQGVLVTLFAQDGTTVITTTTTDGLGNYAFNGIAAGCYVIGFSNLPPGYSFSPANAGSDTSKNSDANTGTGKTGTVCIAAGQNNSTIDAGVFNNSNTNSIGDKVWYDVNHDGLQNSGEYGYPGVVVTLFDCNSNGILATTTTDANGEYQFSGLANGNYYVGFGFIPGYQFTGANTDLGGVLGANNSDANPSSGLSDCVNLIGNTNLVSLDAGIYPGSNRSATSTLGDIVWVDVNGNGLQDAGEPGVSNVTVNLYHCSDLNSILATTTTDGIGNYVFTNLTDGEYVVSFVPTSIPAGFSFTIQGSNIEDENNSDANSVTGMTTCIQMGLGEDKMSVDAGIVPPPSTVCLGDYVWFDLNNNGIQDIGEPAAPGVSVKLYDNNFNIVLQVTTTNEEGKYLFCGLTNGSLYSVGFENLPSGYGFTTQSGALSVADNSDANPLSGRTATVTLGATNDLTLDAGIYSATSAVVGNYVWYDEDADGIQDPTEAPIPGVLVTLYDNTNTPVASAVTDANGGYLFTNVIPGTYTIGFEGYPNTLVPTTKGSNPGADDDSNIDPITGRTDAFTVTAGSSNLTLDAGYKANPIAGLGNYVWHDVNQNGLQDPSEAPIAGVVVTLYTADGSTPLGTAITDGNGAYSFPNLTAGSYVVGFSNIPVGFTRTQVVGGLNDALNSDIDANLRTSVVTLTAGTYNPNIDAGFYVGVPLSARELVATLVKQQGTEQAIIYWYTKDEENTATFEIERSFNGSDFAKVGTLLAGGTTQGQTDYSATDDINGLESVPVIYYRIKLIDIDSKQKYSNTVSLKPGMYTNDGVVVHPVPFTNSLTISYLAEVEESIQLELVDMNGRVIVRSERNLKKGLNHVVLDNLDGLSSAQYMLRIIPSGGNVTQVIRVNK